MSGFIIFLLVVLAAFAGDRAGTLAEFQRKCEQGGAIAHAGKVYECREVKP